MYWTGVDTHDNSVRATTPLENKKKYHIKSLFFSKVKSFSKVKFSIVISTSFELSRQKSGHQIIWKSHFEMSQI